LKLPQYQNYLGPQKRNTKWRFAYILCWVKENTKRRQKKGLNKWKRKGIFCQRWENFCCLSRRRNTQNGKHVVRFSSFFAASLFAKLSANVRLCMGVSVCESEAQTISFIMLCCRASLKWHDIKNSKKDHTLTRQKNK